MKIYCPHPKQHAIGGPFSFVRNLRKSFKEQHFGNISFTDNHKEANAILFPVVFSKAWLRYYKRMGKPIIQRLDGLYYPEKHGKNHKLKNKKMVEVYKKLATHVIFQSKHSEGQFNQLAGETHAEKLEIIHNGARDDIFKPANNHTFNPENIRFITAGNFRDKDMIQPIITALDMLAEKYNFTLTLIGALNINVKERDNILAKPYVQFKGKMNLEEIAQQHQEHDIFLFSHLNPPCPNAVVEALASGLPVVSFDSGSLRELCKHQLDLLAPTKKQSLFHSLDDFSPKQLSLCTEKAILHYTSYKAEALKHAENYSMTLCAARYAQAIQSIALPKKKPAAIELFYRLLVYVELPFEFTQKVAMKILEKICTFLCQKQR